MTYIYINIGSAKRNYWLLTHDNCNPTWLTKNLKEENHVYKVAIFAFSVLQVSNWMSTIAMDQPPKSVPLFNTVDVLIC